MEKVKCCSECGAKIIKYTHKLNKMLVESLIKLYRAGGTANASKIGLSNYQWNNFQKLQYWGVVVKSYDEAGKRMGGFWTITPVGVSFLKGNYKLNKRVVSYRGKFDYFVDGDMVYWNDILPTEYETAMEYIENSINA